jgi:hypothetical protein
LPRQRTEHPQHDHHHFAIGRRGGRIDRRSWRATRRSHPTRARVHGSRSDRQPFAPPREPSLGRPLEQRRGASRPTELRCQGDRWRDDRPPQPRLRRQRSPRPPRGSATSLPRRRSRTSPHPRSLSTFSGKAHVQRPPSAGGGVPACPSGATSAIAERTEPLGHQELCAFVVVEPEVVTSLAGVIERSLPRFQMPTVMPRPQAHEKLPRSSATARIEHHPGAWLTQGVALGDRMPRG